MDHSNTGDRLDLQVPAQAASLARIRRQLSTFLAEHAIDDDLHANALLVTNELAANAITHDSSTDDQLQITITLAPQSLLIRVRNPARTDAAPALLGPDESRESGRGMLIVDHLATWKQQLYGGRREITAQLPLPRAQP